MPALKVFCTPIGFHDAYVAAPSRKAALAAWGSDKNLFARGLAHVVEDPALTAEPLARPGEVIRRLRATADEQLAALPPVTPRARRHEPKRGPRPSRAALDEGEAAVAAAEKRYAAARAALAEREAALARERRALDAEQAREEAALTAARDAAAETYDRAMRAWRG